MHTRFLSLMLMTLLLSPAVAVSASTDYTGIDAHARYAPSSATGSVQALTDYLVAPAADDREKARAVFTWIAHNISYDASTFGEAPDPTLILKRRRAVCAGYAALFQAMAEAADLQVVTINGDAKGIGPSAAIGPDGFLNHDWNAVKLEGRWRLIDCTWGAGYLDENGRFVRRFCDHYFLTPPDQFVYDHFPLDPAWQLLDPPLSREQYRRQVHTQPAFFQCGLSLGSQRLAAIEADGSMTIDIGAPPDTQLLASLSQNGCQLEERYTFTQRDGDRCVIDAFFPAPGDYTLTIFARKRDSDSPEYDSALEYTIHSRSGSGGCFPKMYQSFKDRGVYLETPLLGTLPAGKALIFRLRAPGAEEVVVGVNGLPQRLERSGGDTFSGPVALEKGYATVYAKFPNYRKHEGLLRYALK